MSDDFFEEDEDPAKVWAAFDAGEKSVTVEPERRALTLKFDAHLSIMGNRLVQAITSTDVQPPKFSRTP